MSDVLVLNSFQVISKILGFRTIKTANLYIYKEFVIYKLLICHTGSYKYTRRKLFYLNMMDCLQLSEQKDQAMQKCAHSGINTHFTSSSAGTQSEHSPIASEQVLPFSILFCITDANECFKNMSSSYKFARHKETLMSPAHFLMSRCCLRNTSRKITSLNK